LASDFEPLSLLDESLLEESLLSAFSRARLRVP
jgi:hypothetical protein